MLSKTDPGNDLLKKHNASAFQDQNTSNERPSPLPQPNEAPSPSNECTKAVSMLSIRSPHPPPPPFSSTFPLKSNTMLIKNDRDSHHPRKRQSCDGGGGGGGPGDWLLSPRPNHNNVVPVTYTAPPGYQALPPLPSCVGSGSGVREMSLSSRKHSHSPSTDTRKLQRYMVSRAAWVILSVVGVGTSV